MAIGHSPSFYDYEYTSLTLFPLEFMCAVSFVFALFLWVCYWDYGLGIMVWELWFGDYGLGIVFLCFRMETHNGLRL